VNLITGFYAEVKKEILIFVVAPCMLIVLSPLFVQLMHTNCYKIVKQLKSFNIIIFAQCFGLHKPSSGSSQPVLRYSYSVDFGYISLFEVTGIVGCICYLKLPVLLAAYVI